MLLFFPRLYKVLVPEIETKVKRCFKHIFKVLYGAPKVTSEYFFLFRFYEMLFRLYEMLFRLYEMLFRFNEILFRFNEITFR